MCPAPCAILGCQNGVPAHGGCRSRINMDLTTQTGGTTVMDRSAATRGWIVTLAGLGINLALGVLYSWSVIAKTLTAEWGWSSGAASLPYAVAVGVFALTMVFAGRAQDRFGPRVVATVGGIAHRSSG
jgi:hypothetical protein